MASKFKVSAGYEERYGRDPNHALEVDFSDPENDSLVVVGMGFRARNDNVTTMHIEYARLNNATILNLFNLSKSLVVSFSILISFVLLSGYFNVDALTVCWIQVLLRLPRAQAETLIFHQDHLPLGEYRSLLQMKCSITQVPLLGSYIADRAAAVLSAQL